MSAHEFNLSDLDGSNDVVLGGIYGVDERGFSVPSGGDVDGDACEAIIPIAGAASCSCGSFAECGFQIDSE